MGTSVHRMANQTVPGSSMRISNTEIEGSKIRQDVSSEVKLNLDSWKNSRLAVSWTPVALREACHDPYGEEASCT